MGYNHKEWFCKWNKTIEDNIMLLWQVSLKYRQCFLHTVKSSLHTIILRIYLLSPLLKQFYDYEWALWRGCLTWWATNGEISLRWSLSRLANLTSLQTITNLSENWISIKMWAGKTKPIPSKMKIFQSYEWRGLIVLDFDFEFMNLKKTRSDILQGQALFRGVKQLRRCLELLNNFEKFSFPSIEKRWTKDKETDR